MAQLTTLANESPTGEILRVMDRDGACIVEHMLSLSDVEATLEEVKPYMERTLFGDDEFSGAKTRRTGALVARSITCREIVTNQAILECAREFLLRFSDRIQLNLTQTICIGPGEGAQPLHRDRFGWGDYIPLDIEPQFNAIWALTDFSSQNGATRIVPGSHKWPLEREPSPSEICHAEMRRGSVLLHSGSVIHSGGENRTKDNRIGLNITYCLGWLRQEENQYLSCPPEIARGLTPDLQELLGYTQGNYALGYYSDPDGTGNLGAGILPPEASVGSNPRTTWISTNDGYRSIPSEPDD